MYSIGCVRMLPTPASTLPQYMHPSTGSQGWHLASPEPPWCRVYGTWVCTEALHSLSCGAGCSKSCFTVFRAKARVAAFRLRPTGAIPAETGSWNTGVGLRQPYMVIRELLIATSTFFTCGLLLQTGAHYSAAGNTRACVEIRSVLAEAPQVVYHQDDGWVRLWM